MEAKAFGTVSCDAIHSPPWEQQKKWVPTRCKG